MEKFSRVSNSRSLEVTSHGAYASSVDVSDAVRMLNEMECDYDTSATELYELLESSDWERARSRCRSNPEEVRTWIVRKDKSKQVRWKLLPLHAAIIFQAPSFVVSSLLERYPAAASRKDDQGMLPLHLAFRHKQEDEDLLELLLVQYPQAVNLRDRRDRVPLEHGRESRYSAKLMRLYAEAATNASQTGHHNSIKKLASGSTALTSHTDSLTQSASHSQLARLEAEHEAKMAVLKSDYEYQLKTMQGKYEDRIQSIQDKTTASIKQTELSAANQRQKLIDQHAMEVNELRSMLSQQVNKDRAMADSLTKEVAILQNSLSEAKTQSEILNDRYTRLVADNEQLRDFLDQICEDQVVIQEIAAKQQQYLEAARSIRAELVQTLMKQEDSEGENDRLRGTKLAEIANNVQRRIHEFMRHTLNASPRHMSQHHGRLDYMERSIENNNSLNRSLNNGRIPDFTTSKNNMVQSSPRHINDYVPNTNNSLNNSLNRSLNKDRLEPKGPSRIEMQRKEDDGDVLFKSDLQGQTEVQAYYVVKGEDTPRGSGNGGATGTSDHRDHRLHTDKYAEVRDETGTGVGQRGTGGEHEEDYGEVRILGDEISAITENSAY